MILDDQPSADELSDSFAAELASSVIGRPLRVYLGFGARTDDALIAVALARPAISAGLVAAARHAFAVEQPAAAAVESAHWTRGPSWAAAVEIAAGVMSWCTAQSWLQPSVGDHRGLRRDWLNALNPVESAASVIDDGGRLLERLASQTPPSQQPPDRLEPRVHAAVFESEIVPEMFADLAAAEQPDAVVVIGTAGGDASILEARRGSAVVDLRLLAAYHPGRWNALVGDDPAEPTSIDARQWARMAIHHAVDRHAAVTVIVDDASVVGEFVETMRGYGYPIRVEADSTAEPIGRLAALAAQRCRKGDWRFAHALTDAAP
jgi:hypothetical protein